MSISPNSKCVLQYSGVCLWQFPRIKFNSGGDQDQDSEEKGDRPRVSGVGASLILVCVSPLLELLHLLCIEHSQFGPLFTDNNILLYSVADNRPLYLNILQKSLVTERSRISCHNLGNTKLWPHLFGVNSFALANCNLETVRNVQLCGLYDEASLSITTKISIFVCLIRAWAN